MSPNHSHLSHLIIHWWEEQPQVAHSRRQQLHSMAQAYSLSKCLCKREGKWCHAGSLMTGAAMVTSHRTLSLRHLRAWLPRRKCKCLSSTNFHPYSQIIKLNRPRLILEWVESSMLSMRKFHFLNINKLNPTTPTPIADNSNFPTRLSNNNPLPSLWIHVWPLRPLPRVISSNRDAPLLLRSRVPRVPLPSMIV